MSTTQGAYGASGLPLAGAILCCTCIAPELRTQLGVIGAQMGATIKLDLTSDVTHLIVGSIESAKYRYVAKSRDDVKVLSPAWLQALRELWMEGDDNMDLAALEAEYRLPTFQGLKICLTGFDDPEQRQYIQEAADQNGAEYHGDLTKAVTHLIAATPTGKKYEHALSWRMKIVSLEWFEQSLERGMVLDEECYNPTMPVEQRGRGAWDRMDAPSPSLGKRQREREQPEAVNPLRRKLRRSASTKMGSQSQALWAGITAPSLDVQHGADDDWTDDNIAKQDATRERTPQVRAQNPSLVDDALPADPAFDQRQPQALALLTNSNDGIFGGRVVLTHHFDNEKTAILRQHLENEGARFARLADLNNFDYEDLKSGYLIMPFDIEADLTSLPGCAGSLNLVTNLWVERCLHGKRLIDPAEDVFCRPLDNLSINGFSGLTINSTGFVGIELLHVTKIVTLLGATYDEQLSAKTSVIICRSTRPNEQKIKFATERSIPVVHVLWLWECVRTGKVQAFSSFQLNTLPPAQPVKSKTRPNAQSLAEVPTARLSTEESFELQQKKRKAGQSGTKSRGSHPPQSLDLAISVNPTPDSTTNSTTNPNSHYSALDQDDSAIPGFDGETSLPLQDIDANSPRRPSTESMSSKPVSRARSSSAESLIRPIRRKKNTVTKQPTPASVIPGDNGAAPPLEADQDPAPPKEPPEEKDYSDILAQLRANRKPLPSPADQVSTTRRRGRRQLGRATSTRSNQSTADSSTGPLNLDDDEDREKEAEYQPSQELGWDSPGAAKAREQMIKRLGGRVTETSVRVEGIGVVRDVPSELGNGGRVGRRRRDKGF